MKHVLILMLLLFSACSKNKSESAIVILDNNYLNTNYLKQIPEPEKALLSWYLFAYGNYCDGESSKIKCQILDILQIEDECNGDHLNFLMQWFSNDMMAVYKLNKCPNLKANSAIQNTLKKIVLIKNADTISIEYSIKGLNTSQEKSWNMNKTERYLITNKNFVKLKTNE